MGIRFLCPNGHKLNVKEFLVGKRAICPECKAKFLVPKESGVRVEPLAEETVSAVSESTVAQVPSRPASETPPTKATSSADTPPAGTEAWYVRLASGEQFGPANADVMRGWITEGRVPVESWVWRTGWAEWKSGGEAITILNGPQAPGVTSPGAVLPVSEPSPPPTDLPETAAADQSMPEHVDPTARYLNDKRYRQARARKATFFLGGLVIVLLAVLVAVLVKNN